MNILLKVLWVEDDKGNIDEYCDESFDQLFGEPIVPSTFEEACKFTEDNLKYDFVIIDIDLSTFADFNNSEYVNKIKEKISFEPKVAGIVIFTMLLESGFPKERILFLTGNARGGGNNTYDDFEKYFNSALMPLPECIDKKDTDTQKQLTKKLESRINPYLTLRRGIIEGCGFLKSHIEKDEGNIQFRDFIKIDKDTKLPIIEIEVTDIKNYFNTLAQFLPIKQPNEQTALNVQYRLFLRTLVHEWEENVNPDRKNKYNDIHTYAWLSKMTRNWVSHANLLEKPDVLNTQIIAFLFLVNMRAMFKLPKEILAYERILLSCISLSPTDSINIEVLARDIKYAEDLVDDLLDKMKNISENENGGFLVTHIINNEEKTKELKSFKDKVNEVYRYNTGQKDVEEHDYKGFLFQYFWINQKSYLKNLTVSPNEFLPTLARHIYTRSFS